MQDVHLKEDMKGAYEKFVGYQAEVNAKMMLNNSQNVLGEPGLGITKEAKLGSQPALLAMSKKSLSARKRSSKSPLDMTDFTNLQYPNKEPDLSQF